MRTRTFSKPVILTLLENSIKERFTYPKRDISVQTIAEIASKLELAAYHYSQIFNDSVETRIVNGEVQRTIYQATKDGSDEEASFDAYLSNIATIIVHTSPEFFTGRHSFMFRDRLYMNVIPKNLLEKSQTELWPEINDNPYLTVKELESIKIQREVERNIVFYGIELLLEQSCNQDECSRDKALDVLKNSQIFQADSAFTKSQNYVCFGEGSGCWEKYSNKIVIPCASGEACSRIPDAARSLFNATNAYKYFSTCMMYEDFLRSFAYQGFEGEVVNPVNKDELLEEDVANHIRKKYMREMKMMRYYLDLHNVE